MLLEKQQQKQSSLPTGLFPARLRALNTSFHPSSVRSSAWSGAAMKIKVSLKKIFTAQITAPFCDAENCPCLLPELPTTALHSCTAPAPHHVSGYLGSGLPQDTEWVRAGEGAEPQPLRDTEPGGVESCGAPHEQCYSAVNLAQVRMGAVKKEVIIFLPYQGPDLFLARSLSAEELCFQSGRYPHTQAVTYLLH